MITSVSACIGGVGTRTLSVGGDGIPVVLLHGFADSADTWRGVLAESEDAQRPAIAVDLPGFGEADPLAPGPMLPALDSFVDALVEERGPVILVGNSLGACLSVRAAARGSANIRAVVAVDEPILASHSAIRLARARLDFVRMIGLSIRMPNGVYRQVNRQLFTRMLYGDPRSADPEVIARWAAQVPDTASIRRLLVGVRAVALETADGYDSVNVRCPLLVVHGRRDRIIPVHASARLHRSVPGSTLIVMPKAGHCPQLDDPAGLARHVLRFIDSRVEH
jgi:pimeloyl-ACP methyl ester carboxylesterase